MSYSLTRRGFLNDAVKVGVASALKLDASPPRRSSADIHPDRKSIFDGHWRFFKGDVEGAYSQDFGDSDWRYLDLPHDWSIEGPFSQDAPAMGNGAYLPTGIAWYRKRFTLPAAASGKRVVLQFDGVYQRSEIWINGKSMGMRPYGFITFSYDLTSYLNATGKPNQIAVRIDNSLQPNCRWYTGSGIYRHTWLVVTDPIYIAQCGTCIRTPSVSLDGAYFEVTTGV
jgi:beta-galactosidase